MENKLRSNRNHEHYTKGRKCLKCNKPIVNSTRGVECKICRLTKEVCIDLKSKRYRQNNPIKIYARKKLFSYINQGKIKKQPCAICKKINKIEAHHEDYSKPLEVIWYCRKHHYEFGHS